MDDMGFTAYPRDPDYGVTRDGRVFRIRRSYKGRPVPFEMKLRRDKDGYLIWGTGKRTYKVHRAVAETYLPGGADQLVVAHIDGSRDNNHVSNLMWATPQINMDHKLIHGTQLRGSGMPQSKLTEAMVEEAKRRKAAGESITRIAPEYGVDRRTLDRAVTKRTWRHV